MWLYATIDHVGGARELERLTLAHDAYRWICGGVQINYPTLSDFRVDHGTMLDELLTDNVAALTVVGVVKLKRAAHDGVRVRASAAREREDRVRATLNCMPEIKEIKQRQGKKAEDARASSTDAQATAMKEGGQWISSGLQHPVRHGL